MHAQIRASVVEQKRACQRRCPGTNTTHATVESRLSSHRQHTWNLLDLPNSDVDHLFNGLQLENLYVFLSSENHRRLHLRHDGDVDDLDTRGLCMWRCTTTGMSRTGPRATPEKLDGRLHSLHCKNITGMSNSVDELKARHNHCHLHRLLELVLHVHKDVTLEGHQEARHLVHGPQGHELPLDGSKYRRSHKTMTMDLSGSKSVCAHRDRSKRARQRMLHRLSLDVEEEAFMNSQPGRPSARRHAPYCLLLHTVPEVRFRHRS